MYCSVLYTRCVFYTFYTQHARITRTVVINNYDIFIHNNNNIFIRTPLGTLSVAIVSMYDEYKFAHRHIYNIFVRTHRLAINICAHIRCDNYYYQRRCTPSSVVAQLKRYRKLHSLLYLNNIIGGTSRRPAAINSRFISKK